MVRAACRVERAEVIGANVDIAFGPGGGSALDPRPGRHGRRTTAELVELVLRRPIALPAGHRSREVDVFPGGMERRLLELGEPREQSVDEADHALVSSGPRMPVIDGEHGRNGDGFYFLARGDELWVILAVERGGKIKLFQFLGIGHGNQLESLLANQLAQCHRPVSR